MPWGRNISRCCFHHETVSATIAASSPDENFADSTMLTPNSASMMRYTRACFNRGVCNGCITFPQPIRYPVGSLCLAHSLGTLPNHLVRELSYTAIQYTPVDCIATVRIPHYLNQLAIAFSSAVVQPKRRTGWLSRAAGRPRSGIRCRYQCRRHPDVSFPS